jgi:hypothetical protein
MPVTVGDVQSDAQLYPGQPGIRSRSPNKGSNVKLKDGELWSLRGLSWWELAKRTCRKSWEGEVFGQAARLAFYYFLGTFPAVLLLLLLFDAFPTLVPSCVTRFSIPFARSCGRKCRR